MIDGGWKVTADEGSMIRVISPQSAWAKTLPTKGRPLSAFEEKTIEEIENPPLTVDELEATYDALVATKIGEYYTQSEENAIKTKALSAVINFVENGDTPDVADTDAFKAFKLQLIECKKSAYLEVYGVPHPVYG